MKITFDHILVNSFIEWFDFTLSNNGEAFVTTSGNLYPIKTDFEASQSIYASPFKPWVFDTSIPNAVVPSGVYDANGNFLTRASGIYFNFTEGWVGSTTPLAAPLSCQFSFKEFDIIYQNEDEDVFTDQTKFVLKPRTTLQAPVTGLAANERTFPCAVIKYDPGQNKNFAFGGMQNTKAEFRVLVAADSAFLLDGILSIFRDTRLSNFSLLDPTALPLDENGDYKGGVPFNYINNISTNPDNFIWVSDVDCIKLPEAAGVKVGQRVYLAMMDFTVERPRNLKIIYPQNVS